MYNNFLLKIIKKKFFKNACTIIIIYICNFENILALSEYKKVFLLLEGRHWSLKTDKFIELGEEVDSILINIAGDSKIINYIRYRAIEALTIFPTEKTANFLEYTSKKSFAALARRGFIAFKIAFSRKKPERVKKLALKLLSHPKIDIRITAARFIRTVDAKKFKLFIEKEKNSWVIKEAQK